MSISQKLELNYKNQIENYANFSFFKDYSSYFGNLKITLNNYENTLNNYWKTTRNLLVQEISKKELLLENLNPQNLLNNGYAIISDLKGNVIDSIKTLEDEKEINIQLKDGKILFKGGK